MIRPSCAIFIIIYFQYHPLNAYIPSCDTNRRYPSILEFKHVDFSHRTFEQAIAIYCDTAPQNVTTLNIINFLGNINGAEHMLANFPNLTSLSFERWDDGNRTLTIHPEAFLRTPNLTHLSIRHTILANSTIQSIASLKDQITNIGLSYAEPNDEIMNTVANFSRLDWVFSNCQDNMSFDTSILAKSSETMKTLNLVCNMPSNKITNRFLAGLPNLISFQLVSSDVEEIETGAFDSNLQLEKIDLWNNRIRTFPDGLFSGLKKLKMVDLSRNSDLRELSRENFTHVENFESFVLKLGAM